MKRVVNRKYNLTDHFKLRLSPFSHILFVVLRPVLFLYRSGSVSSSDVSGERCFFTVFGWYFAIYPWKRKCSGRNGSADPKHWFLQMILELYFLPQKRFELIRKGKWLFILFKKELYVSTVNLYHTISGWKRC